MSWDETREQVSRALSSIAARETALRGTATSLDVAIIEAIVDLDSEQEDSVATLGEGGLLEYSVDGYVRPGQLQRLTALEATFFGDGAEQPGLIAAMRAIPDASSAEF